MLPPDRPALGAWVPVPGTRFTVQIIRYYSHTSDVLVRYGNGATGTKTLAQLQIQPR